MGTEEYKHELYNILQELVYFSESFKPIVRKTNEVEELYNKENKNKRKKFHFQISEIF